MRLIALVLCGPEVQRRADAMLTAGVRFEELDDRGFIESSPRNLQNDQLEIGFRGRKRQPVELEECESSHRSDALVAINKWVVLYDME